jgi:hypothetical protein
MEDLDATIDLVPPESNDKPPSPETLSKDTPSCLILNHPKENILGRIGEGKRLQYKVLNQVSHMFYLSQFESKKVEKAQ